MAAELEAANMAKARASMISVAGGSPRGVLYPEVTSSNSDMKNVATGAGAVMSPFSLYYGSGALYTAAAAALAAHSHHGSSASHGRLV